MDAVAAERCDRPRVDSRVTPGVSDPVRPGGEMPRLRGPAAIRRTMQQCTKCGVCQVYCPVAAVSEEFPGPKYAGPQAERFRVIEAMSDDSSALCSGCGVCTSVCPNGVAITDLITIARAEMVAAQGGVPLRQRLLNRPDTVGRILGVAPRIANAVLGSRTLRAVAHATVGIHRNAPLPHVSGPRFRRWLAARPQPDGPTLAYFSGCAVEHYDPGPGIAAVRILNHLGFLVEAPSAACCSLPMLSSGEWDAARPRAEALVRELATSSEAQTPIVSTSTSCSLTLRSKYAAYLGMEDGAAARVARAVVDICEFLRGSYAKQLAAELGPVSARAVYHAPCQLRSHGMGQPAVELLRFVPDLSVESSGVDCCGIAGTYGYDCNRHAIAARVARTLIDRIAEAKPDFVICDSETCRWHVERLTGLACFHPVEILDASLHGTALLRPLQW